MPKVDSFGRSTSRRNISYFICICKIFNEIPMNSYCEQYCYDLLQPSTQKLFIKLSAGKGITSNGFYLGMIFLIFLFISSKLRSFLWLLFYWCQIVYSEIFFIVFMLLVSCIFFYLFFFFFCYISICVLFNAETICLEDSIDKIYPIDGKIRGLYLSQEY